MRSRVLVIDDDAALAEMLGIVLRAEGFEVDFCFEGHLALDAFRRAAPDVVLLDVMLPGLNGIDVCRVLRMDSSVPIVMLTARGDTADVVRGLEAGADDYVVKPFKPKELVARVRARIRSSQTAEGSRTLRELHVGDLIVDVAGRTVSRGGTVIELTPLEFDLLVALAMRPGEVRSREDLLKEVWGYTHTSDTRLVNVHVQRLRSKVELDADQPQVVLTVRGVGYKAAVQSPALPATESTRPASSTVNGVRAAPDETPDRSGSEQG